MSLGVRRGFSLIELLAVMVVMGILSLLTYQLVGQVREKTNMVQCSQHMRQWGQAFQLYALEHNGELPTYVGSYWQEAIAPYVVGREINSNAPQRFALRDEFGCSNDDKTFDNWAYGTSNYLNSSVYNKAPRTFMDIVHLDHQAILVETEASGVWNVNPTNGVNGNGIFYSRHDGVANFVFADLHVEPLSYEEALHQIIIRPTDTPR